MAEFNTEQPTNLSSEERALLIDLLENERGNLPAEIHRSRTTDSREQLRHRLDTTTHLLERLQHGPHG